MRFISVYMSINAFLFFFCFPLQQFPELTGRQYSNMRKILNQILIDRLSKLVLNYTADLSGFNKFRLGHYRLEDKTPEYVYTARVQAKK